LKDRSLGNIENIGTTQSFRALNLVMTPTGKQAVNMPVPIHPAWTVPKFCVPPQRLVNLKVNVKRTWKHLEDSDIPAVSTDQIGLLIGVHVTEARIQHEYRRGPKGQLSALRIDFELNGRLLVWREEFIPPEQVWALLDTELPWTPH